MQDFDTSVEAGITSDQRFDFKVYLIPYKGSKTDADAAMTFVREDDLTDEQRSVMDQVRTIIREKKVPVGGSEEFLPGQVVEKVKAQIDRDFTLHMHTQAWRYFGVRPPSDAPDQYSTKRRILLHERACRQARIYPGLDQLPCQKAVRS